MRRRDRLGAIGRLTAIAVMLLQCWTLEADATVYFTNNQTGSDSNDGLAATTGSGHGPFGTLAKLNAVLRAFDTGVIGVSPLIYDATINPVDSCVTYVGDSLTRSNVKVPGVLIKHRRALVNGVRVDGSATVTDFDGSTDGRDAHLRNIDIVGSVYSLPSGLILDRFRVGVGNCATTSQFRIGPIANPANNVTIRNGSMNLRLIGTPSTDHLMDLEPQCGVVCATMRNWVVQSVNCTLTVTPGQVFEKIAMWNHLAAGLFETDSLLFVDSCGIPYGTQGTAAQALVVRDSVKNMLFDNLAIEFRSPNGIGKMQALVYSSGAQQRDSANVWRRLHFKSNIDCSAAASWDNEWVSAYRDSLTRCEWICNTGSPCMQMEGAIDSTFLYRNTLVNLGGGAALKLIPDANTASAWGSTVGRIVSSGNIFEAKGGTGAVDFTIPSFAGGLVSSDQNLYFLPILGGSTKAFKYILWGYGPTTFKPVGSLNGTGLEVHSRWGDPLFADSNYATFNPSLLPGSAAIGAGPAGVDCGARDYLTPTPATITDLRSSGSTSESVVLIWTAPGANGNVGTATGYTLKYSTSPITEANFNAATTVATGPPKPPGVRDLAGVYGLAPGTTYYFAIKATNGTRYGAISNVMSDHTWPVDALEP